MNNPMLQMLMSQLQSKNPNGYSLLNQMMNSGGNPQQLLQQLVGKSSPQQLQGIMQQAKQFGVPDDILSQLQNMGR